MQAKTALRARGSRDLRRISGNEISGNRGPHAAVLVLVKNHESEPRLRFGCPLLGGEVELTPERERHIQARHPELLVILRQRLRETLQAPDAVRASPRRPQALEFLRWYPVFPRRKWVVVVVLRDQQGADNRHWIITAYVTNKDRTGGPR